MATRKYMALVERFALTPIKNNAHLDEAYAIAQSLMLREKATEENDYLEVLLDEISKYESKHHALKMHAMSPLELLLSFMKDHSLKQIDVATIIGASSGVTNEIIKGKRELTKEQCVKLGHHFRVSPALFLPKILV